MICPNCNAELREGAKFCAKCGQKVAQANTCISCGAELRPGAKFCAKCGTRQASAADAKATAPAAGETKAAALNTAPDMSQAGGRIYWNVQPGQVARIIREDEFEQYSKVKGVIVPEGTTAYIRANGKVIASISGGAYDFVGAPPQEVGLLSRGWQFLCNLFGSKKKDEKVLSAEEQLYMNQQKAILENAKNGASFAIIILLNKAFPVLIGAKQASIDDYKNFAPMRIQTRFLEMQVGVNAYFKISDPEAFIIHYLTDKQQLNTAVIVDEITDSVRVTLQDALYDTELSTNRIPAELHTMLKDRINAVAQEAFFGISVVRIVEISAESQDLERFTKLSQELYLSEKELDYLHRTNDFKNRLADAVNAQQLHEATTEVEMARCLNAINRDMHNEELLNAEELRKFEHLLLNERILREAQSDAERDMALMEIAQTGLVRKEELQVLCHQIKTNEFQRGSALRMMQLRDALEFERVRMQGEMDKAEAMVRKELELQGLRDDYADSQFYKELDRQSAVANRQLDIEQRQRDMDFNDEKRRRDLEREEDAEQFRQFMAMQEAEERNRENQRRHEAQMEQARQQNELETERMKWERAESLSDEKVWALQGGKEAAVAYASTLNDARRERESAEREREHAREMAAQRDADNARYDERLRQQDEMLRANQDRMFEMMNNLINVTGGVQAQRADERNQYNRERQEEKDRQLREQDERLRRQESRMDTAYDRALDYTTRNNVAPQVQVQPQAQPVYAQPAQQPVYVQPAAPQPTPQPAQPTPQPAEKAMPALVCKECGSEIAPGAAFCDDCGTPV